MAGAELQGSLSASVTFSAWLKMTNEFVVRASLIFSVGFGSKQVDPTTMLVGLMGGTDSEGQLLHENKTAVVEALYRQGARLREIHGEDTPHMRHLLADNRGVHELDSVVAFELDEFGRHPSQPGFEELALTGDEARCFDETTQKVWECFKCSGGCGMAGCKACSSDRTPEEMLAQTSPAMQELASQRGNGALQVARVHVCGHTYIRAHTRTPHTCTHAHTYVRMHAHAHV